MGDAADHDDSNDEALWELRLAAHEGQLDSLIESYEGTIEESEQAIETYREAIVILQFIKQVQTDGVTKPPLSREQSQSHSSTSTIIAEETRRLSLTIEIDGDAVTLPLKSHQQLDTEIRRKAVSEFVSNFGPIGSSDIARAFNVSPSCIYSDLRNEKCGDIRQRGDALWVAAEQWQDGWKTAEDTYLAGTNDDATPEQDPEPSDNPEVIDDDNSEAINEDDRDRGMIYAFLDQHGVTKPRIIASKLAYPEDRVLCLIDHKQFQRTPDGIAIA